jgi:tetratricopeptide (TPR) repeat protein
LVLLRNLLCVSLRSQRLESNRRVCKGPRRGSQIHNHAFDVCPECSRGDIRSFVKETVFMRSRNNVVSYFWFLVAVGLVVSTLHARQATVKESNQVFRTCPFSDPDPVAKMTNIYPYFRFEGYSITPVDRKWKVVTLENPYIKVTIATEIGGKILGALEKSTGKAFIYTNNVIKFREIAMRGPWTSGGIEFNFGDIGHTPATSTPVDYMTRTNEDGSVSCIVGALDLASRTEWRVEIRLPKDKAYFQTESFWYNPTDLNTSLYHWMNAAADASPDLQLLYPGSGYIDHGGGAFSWPKDDAGRDISRYANNAFGPAKSYHVLGAYTDTYAAYYAQSDFGVVHWSPYTDKPGKKIWIWALSREGEIWKDLLTDPELGNGQYVEIQSGLLFNQAAGGSTRTPFKHEAFAPLSEENFVEAWFPFKGIGGLVEANLHGSLNVQNTGGKLTIAFCPLEKVNQPLVVSIGGKEIYKRELTLQPLQVFVDSLSSSGEGEIEVSVGDLVSFKSQEASRRQLQRPQAANKEFDWNSVSGLFTDAVERARQRDYKGALEKYLACLSKDPRYTPALAGISEVYYRRMEYQKALENARRALANDAYDPDANFIYGVISKNLGNLYDALDGFGAAARSMKYRSAANAEMAEVAFLQKHWPAAEAYAFRSLDYDRSNMRASRLLTVLYRVQRKTENAKDAVAHLKAIDPLSHMADFENYLVDRSEENLDQFRSMIRNELPSESYLELASYYLGLKLFEDAALVLQQSPAHPMVYYWLAYLSDLAQQPQKAGDYLTRAIEQSAWLVFPFRQESEEILRWADSQKPHWKTKYFLALLLWSKDRIDAAREEFADCGNEPSYAAFYIARGNFLKAERSEDALRDYKRAFELGQSEWRTYRALIDFYNGRTQYSEALEISKLAVKKFSSSYVALFDLARSFVLNRQYAAGLKILDTLTVLPFEGARYTREVYRQACVLSATEEMKAGSYVKAVRSLENARQWPERLGAGKPYGVDNRLEDYLEGVCSKKSGNSARAKKMFDQVISSTRDHSEDVSINRLFGALAERESGKQDFATKLADEWSKDVNSPIARWLSAVLTGNSGNVAGVVKELRGSTGVSLLGRPSVDQDFALIAEVHSLIGF